MKYQIKCVEYVRLYHTYQTGGAWSRARGLGWAARIPMGHRRCRRNGGPRGLPGGLVGRYARAWPWGPGMCTNIRHIQYMYSCIYIHIFTYIHCRFGGLSHWPLPSVPELCNSTMLRIQPATIQFALALAQRLTRQAHHSSMSLDWSAAAVRNYWAHRAKLLSRGRNWIFWAKGDRQVKTMGMDNTQ